MPSRDRKTTDKRLRKEVKKHRGLKIPYDPQFDGSCRPYVILSKVKEDSCQ